MKQSKAASGSRYYPKPFDTERLSGSNYCQEAAYLFLSQPMMRFSSFSP